MCSLVFDSNSWHKHLDCQRWLPLYDSLHWSCIWFGLPPHNLGTKKYYNLALFRFLTWFFLHWSCQDLPSPQYQQKQEQLEPHGQKGWSLPQGRRDNRNGLHFTARGQSSSSQTGPSVGEGRLYRGWRFLPAGLCVVVTPRATGFLGTKQYSNGGKGAIFFT